MSLEENNYSQLRELSGSDFEIVDGEPNIIGWDVKNGEGTKIGDVDDLLFDPQSRKVRYLLVDLDSNYLNLTDGRTVLIPIGIAELHGEDVHDQNAVTAQDTNIDSTDSLQERSAGIGNTAYGATQDGEADEVDANDHAYNPEEDEENIVILRNVTVAQLLELPSYEKGKLTQDKESLIRKVFEGAGMAGAATGSDFYDHDHFNEDRFYAGSDHTAKLPVIEENLQVGKLEVETGGARITSRLVERPVEESLNLKEEHVNVERTPVNRPVTANDQAFQPTEIELTEHAEIPVISKEARVVEEVSLSKDIQESEETIRDSVRNTEVDTVRIPDKDSEPGRITDSESGRA